MLKRYLTNFLMVFCIIFACLCGLGCFILLLAGDIFMMCLCGLGLAITLSGAITLSEQLNPWD